MNGRLHHSIPLCQPDRHSFFHSGLLIEALLHAFRLDPILLVAMHNEQGSRTNGCHAAHSQIRRGRQKTNKKNNYKTLGGDQCCEENQGRAKVMWLGKVG